MRERAEFWLAFVVTVAVVAIIGSALLDLSAADVLVPGGIFGAGILAGLLLAKLS